jgi:(1->4)-alpha-D-glucan 1-alpha-D-glucosylmutase
VLGWAAAGDVAGVRIDHVDGLARPGRYLGRLAAELPPGSWIAVEKILPPGEDLPATWPCAGTTGYEALRAVGELFVDPAGEAAFTELDLELTGRCAGWAETVREARQEILTTALAAEMRRLDQLLAGEQAAALPLLLCHLQVYGLDLPDRHRHLQDAAAAAAGRDPDLAAAVGAVAGRLADPDDPLAVAVGQVCADLAVLAVEFVAFYRWTRFLGLNETGGDPTRFGCGIEEFHGWCRRRLERRPAAMTTLSTHDTKRATEDVRARLAVLSELPARWAEAVRGWAAAAPIDPESTHLFWQTVVGAWPLDRQRLADSWRQALRDAGRHTTNDRPDLDYEDAAMRPVRLLRADGPLAASVDRFVRGVDPAGRSNALGQKLLQLTMPGVPDTYQGSELPSYRLAAPDNRAPVDFAALAGGLAALDTPDALPLRVDGAGLAKLAVVRGALRLRRDRPEAFRLYRPLRPAGPAAEHAVAFDRGDAVTVVTRLPVGLGRAGGWRETILRLPGGHWRDVLTGRAAAGEVALAELLADLPVALLARG